MTKPIQKLSRNTLQSETEFCNDLQYNWDEQGRPYVPGLKLGQVIRVNWVRFCLDQAGLTRFINMQVWPRFCTGLCALLMISAPNLSNELSLLDSDDGIVSLGYLRLSVPIRVLWSRNIWITHSHDTHLKSTKSL